MPLGNRPLPTGEATGAAQGTAWRCARSLPPHAPDARMRPPAGPSESPASSGSGTDAGVTGSVGLEGLLPRQVCGGEATASARALRWAELEPETVAKGEDRPNHLGELLTTVGLDPAPLERIRAILSRAVPCRPPSRSSSRQHRPEELGEGAAVGGRDQVARVGEIRGRHRRARHLLLAQAEVGKQALVERALTAIAPAACSLNIVMSPSAGARAAATLGTRAYSRPPELASRRTPAGRACSPPQGRGHARSVAAPARRDAASAVVRQPPAGLRRIANRGAPHRGQ
jgi:hypothetical protein